MYLTLLVDIYALINCLIQFRKQQINKIDFLSRQTVLDRAPGLRAESRLVVGSVAYPVYVIISFLCCVFHCIHSSLCIYRQIQRGISVRAKFLLGGSDSLNKPFDKSPNDLPSSAEQIIQMADPFHKIALDIA